MQNESKKQLRDSESAKVISSNIKNGTGYLTLSYKNRFGFKQETTFECFKRKVYAYPFLMKRLLGPYCWMS